NAIDDDKGPIHTIPAPNLAPNSNTNIHYELGISKPQSHTQVTIQQSHGYEVREPSNDQVGHTHGGVATYFAPDPDPSLPAHKVPATTDPHSLPSNAKFPASHIQSTLQILDPNAGVSNHLSSQTVRTVPCSTTTSTTTSRQLRCACHQQQPQSQHYQQTNLFPNSNYITQDNQGGIKTDFNPEFQSFNYEEQYKNAGGQEVYSGEYQEQEGSENVPVVRKSPEGTLTSYQNENYEQKSNSLSEGNSYYDNDANNADGYEKSNNNDQNDSKQYSYFPQVDGGNGALGSSYYTTLPNREAAETLATLAAAGNINSHLANMKNGRQEDRAQVTEDDKDSVPAVPQEEEGEEEEEIEYVEEEEEEEGDEEQPEVTPVPAPTQPPQITKPVPVVYQRQKENDVRASIRFPSRQNLRKPSVPIREEGTENEEETRQSDSTEETQQKPSNVQFGTRIRPKRNK
ncbi:hypothetical protein L9F63_003371, partial [Diploptera punctata]